MSAGSGQTRQSESSERTVPVGVVDAPEPVPGRAASYCQALLTGPYRTHTRFRRWDVLPEIVERLTNQD